MKNKIKTKCKGCIFATGDPQTGCKLERLHKFKRLGKTVVEDGMNIIQGICNTKREEKWKKKHNRYLVDVYKEVFVKVDIVIICKDKTKIKRILHSINSQIEKPNDVFILCDKLDDMKEFCSANVNLINIFNEDISVLFPKLSGQYVIFLEEPMKESLVQKINTYLNHKLEDFIVIDDTPLCFNKAFITIMNIYEKMSFEQIKHSIEKLNKEYVKTWKSL